MYSWFFFVSLLDAYNIFLKKFFLLLENFTHAHAFIKFTQMTPNFSPMPHYFMGFVFKPTAFPWCFPYGHRCGTVCRSLSTTEC